MTNLQPFAKTFSGMVIDRIAEISSQVMVKNKEHIELAEKALRLQHEIIAALPDEAKRLAYELDEVESLLEAIIVEIVYKQALRDGLELRNILGMGGLAC